MNRPALGPPLAAFVSAVEHGSFAAAARVLGISPAALGQSVRRLEDQLGARLLNRTTRTMSLTPEGRMLLERAHEPLRELEEIARIFQEARGEVSGPLRITAPIGVARHQLAAIVADFSRIHPAVRLELEATDEVLDMVQESIDVAIRILLPQDSSIIARPIADLPAVTVAAPSYLQAAGEPAEPDDLKNHAFIGYRYRPSGRLADLQFTVRGRTVLLPFQPRLIVSDVEVACELAALGMGIAQPPGNYVRGYLESRRLVRILSNYVATPWRLYVCYPNRRRLPLRVRTFVDFVSERLGKMGLS